MYQPIAQIFIDNANIQLKNIPRTLFGYVDDAAHYSLLGLSCTTPWVIQYRFIKQVNTNGMYFRIKVYKN